ncbi:hypothetical protein L7F22_004912 [Adiantum nelumboides]|nr:hypothetical protein [Adiantum nelumboides]
MRLPMASMLEGFVSQLLADYLSNYVQGIHPEQFRLGLWNGIAQLENLELRLEAFDYLQLPIAIKNGSRFATTSGDTASDDTEAQERDGETEGETLLPYACLIEGIMEYSSLGEVMGDFNGRI